jgi:hypothetical protein
MSLVDGAQRGRWIVLPSFRGTGVGDPRTGSFLHCDVRYWVFDTDPDIRTYWPVGWRKTSV